MTDIRVLIADDQAAVREGLALLLETMSEVSVVGQAGDGLEAAALAAELAPDVVLMDLNMPRADGIEATASILAANPAIRIVVLTTYEDDKSIVGALRAGALGYLTKAATRADIERAVKAAAAGQAILDPAVQRQLLAAATGNGTGGASGAGGSGNGAGGNGTSAASGAATTSAAGPEPADDLSPREADVLRLIAAGHSNREIAKKLFVGEATVKSHINRIFTKTGCRDRAQAVQYAFTHGYADPGTK
ncbi:response regulator transcription factor [Catenulispora sp. NF23]|uniref:Response regulator transcription factor n=1 Tax=Catenulispora pinistramenti TaxID=2705254 RepID=A0ABS5L8H4_9ACTN|nr:response regulator transcription factor [Catenulispora pinistramenti]MBS2540067.1 response regulator transcription factor [Catenulispora pinistramenti]MBS2554663.1 response regulator transcription factor [Catenulispora pinistramenti]